MGLVRELRESLGFSLDEVAAAAGWSRGRQRQIEASDDPETHEADRLADLFGTDIEAVLENGVLPEHPVAALLRGGATRLDAASRFSIAEATSVARAVRELQRALGEADGWSEVSAFRANPDYSHPRGGTPGRLAGLVRERFGLGTGPIRSLTGDVLARLGVLVLWERLPSSIDAFSFANEECGAVFVGNLAGPHMGSAFGRRVTWAHELCHVLFDRPQSRQMRRFCEISRRRRRSRGPGGDVEYEIERRARAFAAYLLAPADELRAFWDEHAAAPKRDRVRAVMERFGIGYEAARSHLDSVGLLPMTARMHRVPTEVPEAFERADPWPESVDALARLGVRPLRGGVVFETVARAVREGLLSDEGAREFLRLGIGDWARVREKLAGARRHGTWRSSSARIGDWL